MKLHRDLNITQKSAWFMLHRLREAWDESDIEPFTSPTEVDETYMGGKRKNMPKSKRKQLGGRGGVGKTAIVGAKDRETNKVKAKMVEATNSETLKGFVTNATTEGSTVYTDDARAYKGMSGRAHYAVNHSIGEYVNGIPHQRH